MEINELILDVQKKYQTSAIIITHDLACAKITANRIAMLLDGKFLKIGPFKEVFQDKNQAIQSFYQYNFTQ